MDDPSIVTYVCSNTPDESGGIFGYEVDSADGTLEKFTHEPGAAMSYLALGPHGEHLYAVDGADGGRITAFSVDQSTGDLTEHSSQSTEGGDPCYVSVDATGQYAFVSNYGGGSVAMFPIEADGQIGPASDIVHHEGSSVDPERQTEPHPHSIGPGPENRFAYALDLGIDRVVVYDIDFEAGTLQPAEAGAVELREGAGPRHFEFHPTRDIAYVINELDSTVTTFEHDPNTGALETVQTVSALPEGYDEETYTADIHVHPSGEWVYGSNRGHDSIAIYAVEDGGSLRQIGHESTGGHWPRDFALGPDGQYLYVENQLSDSLAIFTVDEDTGDLSPTAHQLELPRPLCMKFLELA